MGDLEECWSIVHLLHATTKSTLSFKVAVQWMTSSTLLKVYQNADTQESELVIQLWQVRASALPLGECDCIASCNCTETMLHLRVHQLLRLVLGLSQRRQMVLYRL